MSEDIQCKLHPKYPGVFIQEGKSYDHHAKHLHPLVGMKIQGVMITEDENSGDPLVSLELVSLKPEARPPAGSGMSTRLQVDVLCDPEGNGPGHLAITKL